MSEMVERIAAVAEQVDPSIWVGEDRPGYYRRVARAAIRAMREPTQAMVTAGEETACPHDEDPEQAAVECWQAMIDEALK